MSTQLRLDLTPRLPVDPEPAFDPQGWRDVSAIAAGVGFEQPVFVSVALSDTLEVDQIETEGCYDQRLYDSLWYAHFELSLNDGRPVHFTFTFPSKQLKTKTTCETSLRLRAERQFRGVFLGLLEDF